MPNTIYVNPTNETIPAGAVYVSPNGVSTNNGTPSSPKDFMSAFNALASGGTLALLGTVNNPYRLGKILINKRVNLLASPGNSPVISGAKVIPSSEFLFESTSNTYYKPNYATAFTPVGAAEATAARPFVVNLQQVFIDGNYITQVGSKNVLVPGSFFVDTANSRLYIKDNPANKKVEVTSEYQGITTTAASDNSKIVGIGIEKYAFSNLVVDGGDNLTIKSVSSFSSGFCNTILRNANSLSLLDHHVGYAGCVGIRVLGYVKNMTYNGGEVFNSNVAGFSGIWNASAMKCSNSESVYPLLDTGINRIQNVTFRDNNTHQLWLDSNATGYRIYDCKLLKGKSGVFVEISDNNYVVNCTFVGNTYGLYLCGANSVKGWNNTFSKNNKNVYVKDTSRRNANQQQFNAGYTWQCRNNEIVNNIFDGSPSSGSTSVLYHTESETSTTSNQMLARSSNNAYYRSSTTQPASIISWDNGTQEYYNDLTTFRSEQPNYESGSIGRTAVVPHPYFVENTLTIKSDSPTKAAGAAVTGVVAEMLGVPSGTVVGVGAVSSVSTPPTPEPDACDVLIADVVAEKDNTISNLNDALVLSQSQLTTLTSEKQALQNKINQVQVQLQNTLTYLE